MTQSTEAKSPRHDNGLLLSIGVLAILGVVLGAGFLYAYFTIY
jgi:hypothetical protein